VRRPAGLLLLLLAVAGCERETNPPATADPYVVQVDVGPQIRAFAEDTLTADEAAEQLERMGPGVIPALAAALEREAKDVRQKVVEVLAAIGTAEAVPSLLEAAQGDADENVRADALRGLGAIGDERGRALLESALADPRLTIRVGGIMGCATLCTSRTAIDRLADIAVRDADAMVAMAARTTLAALRRKGPAEDEAVREAVARRRPSVLPPKTRPDERALAALLASDLDGAAGAQALVAALGEASPPLQRQVAWRLGAVGDADSVAALGKLLESPDTTVRLYACDALAKLRDRGVTAAAGALAGYSGQKPRRPLARPEL